MIESDLPDLGHQKSKTAVIDSSGDDLASLSSYLTQLAAELDSNPVYDGEILPHELGMITTGKTGGIRPRRSPAILNPR